MDKADKKTTEPGYINRNGQMVVRNTGERGSNEFAWKYELECSHCREHYGANGYDIHERKCPNPDCPSSQRGRPGLPLMAAMTNARPRHRQRTLYAQVGRWELVFIDLVEACKLARIHYSVETSRTWGEFRKKMPQKEYAHLLGEKQRTFYDYARDRLNTAAYLEEEEAAKQFLRVRKEYRELGFDERIPCDEDKFDAHDVLCEGDWPKWPPQSWMPEDIVMAFGEPSSRFNGESYVLSPKHKREILQRLAAAGIECIESDGLVNLAVGNGFRGNCNAKSAMFLIEDMERLLPQHIALGPDEHNLPDQPAITRAKIDYILECLPTLQSMRATDVFDQCLKQETQGAVRYHLAIEDLVARLAANDFLQPFEWDWERDAQPYIADPKLVGTATLKKCAHLLTVHVDMERIQPGHFGEMVRTGHISSVLRRLAELRETLGEVSGDNPVWASSSCPRWPQLVFPLRPSDRPTVVSPAPITYGKTDYSSSVPLDSFLVCGGCHQLKGAWKEYVQGCSCERKFSAAIGKTLIYTDTPSVTLPKPVPYETGVAIAIYACCGFEVIEPTSRYTGWFCRGCSGLIETFNNRYSGRVFATNRFVPRTLLLVSIASVVKFGTEVLTGNLKLLGFAAGDDVKLNDYLDRVAVRQWNKCAAFEKMKSELYERVFQS